MPFAPKLTIADRTAIRATPKRYGIMAKLARQYRVSHETIRRTFIGPKRRVAEWPHSTSSAR